MAAWSPTTIAANGVGDVGSNFFGTYCAACRCGLPLPHGEGEVVAGLPVPSLRRSKSASRLQFPRRCRVPPDEIGHVEPGNLPILHDPATAHHHAVGAMRAAQYKRREWITAARKPQLVEPEQREIG